MLGTSSLIWISAGLVLGSSPGPRTHQDADPSPALGTRRTAAVARNWTPGVRSAKPGGSSGRRPAGVLPDSVLIRIGDHRDVVRSFAVRRWREQHPAADSITPAKLREFLDLLTDEALLTEAAVHEGAAWSPADSATHRQVRDQRVLAVALDSVLAATRDATPNGAALDGDSIGTLARDRVVARLGATYDEAALARLARSFAALPRPSADSSVGSQLRVLGVLPHLSGVDSSAVLARSQAGDVRAAEVVAAWGRLSLAYRPRIDTPEQVRDLVRNQLFERVLRAASTSPRFERDPRVVAALTDDAERASRRGYLERNVLAGIVIDSVAVAAYWNRHADEWRLPLRVRGIRLVLGDRVAAVRMATTLAEAGAAESLAVRAARRGVDYRFVVSAESDSALFRRALAAGPGGVLGPMPRDGSWWVARVGEVIHGRVRSLEEIREQVTGRCYAEEAERRARALASRLRDSMRVESNGAAAELLARELRRPPGDAAATPP